MILSFPSYVLSSVVLRRRCNQRNVFLYVASGGYKRSTCYFCATAFGGALNFVQIFFVQILENLNEIREPEERVELSSIPYHGTVLPLNYSGEYRVEVTDIFLNFQAAI